MENQKMEKPLKQTGVAVKITYTLYFNDDEDEIDFGSSDTQFQIINGKELEVIYTTSDGKRQCATMEAHHEGPDEMENDFETYTQEEFEEKMEEEGRA